VGKTGDNVKTKKPQKEASGRRAWEAGRRAMGIKVRPVMLAKAGGGQVEAEKLLDRDSQSRDRHRITNKRRSGWRKIAEINQRTIARIAGETRAHRGGEATFAFEVLRGIGTTG